MKKFLVAMVALVATVAGTGAQTQAQLRTMDQNGNGFIEKEEMTMLPKGQAGDTSWRATVTLGDSNHDGKLSLSEFTSYTMKMKDQGAGAVGQGRPQFANPDTNSNGFMEKDEMAKMLEPILGLGKFTTSCWENLLKKADKDGDGKIGMQEFATGGMEIDFPKVCRGVVAMVATTGAETQAQLESKYKTMDQNNNGFIEKEEMVAFMGADKVTDPCWQAMVNKADKNKDGQIGMKEVAVAMEGNTPKACSGPHYMGTDELVKFRQWNKMTDICWNAILKKVDIDGKGHIIKTELSEAVAILQKGQKYGNMTVSVAESIADPPEACSGASSLTTVLSVLTLLALALRLF